MDFTFEQFYLACLSHASYLIGSDGIAAVVDPQRDVDIYLDAASERGLKIQYVIETHLHADFVSGHNELADRTGASIYLGERAGASFPHIPARDGDEIRFGRAVLRFLETPGHTVESVCVLLTDLDRAESPFAVLTGDTLFIGDVGRPDLATGNTPQELAGMLYDSLHQKLLTLDDAVEVYPAHGAGSLCGRQMSSERKSTIGQQKSTNYALRAAGREEFIQLLTAELPERPKYFSMDVEQNRTGAAPLSELPPLAAIEPQVAFRLQRAGVILLDTRPGPDFASAHIPHSIQIGLGGQYASWAGILLEWNSTIVLIAEDEPTAIEARLRLARVGIEQVAGYLTGGVPQWIREGLPVEQTSQISVQELNESREGIQIVDVRKPAEWQDGHIPGAMLMPLHQLTALTDDLDRARPIAVHCKGGYRSAIAASLLQRAGFRDVMNVVGGFDAWRTCDLPVAVPDRSAATTT